MSTAQTTVRDGWSPVRVTNRDGGSPFLLICDHASNFMPEPYGRLGLEAADLDRHIAWDPGALPVAAAMASALDAPLVQSCVSRLVIDCNRPLDAPDLIPALSETTAVPGNAVLSAKQRAERIALAWTPFHDAVSRLVGERLARGKESLLVAIHSFTPVYKGRQRPWQVGIIHDDDMRLAGPVLEALAGIEGLTVGDNEPYSPADRVYHTLERHGRSRGLPCVMIEIRNDEIRDEAGQGRWAEMLAGMLGRLEPAFDMTGRTSQTQTVQPVD